MSLSKRAEKKAKKKASAKQRCLFSMEVRKESVRYLESKGVPIQHTGLCDRELFDVLNMKLNFGKGESKADTRRRAYHALMNEGYCVGLKEKTPLISKARKNSSGIVKNKQHKNSPSRANHVKFFSSEDWRILRYKALLACKGICQCCGAGPSPGKPLHVDHIKPRSKFPQLELVLSNLQVLCEDCNLGKLAWDDTDWRNDEIKEKMSIASRKVLWDKDTTWEQLENKHVI